MRCSGLVIEAEPMRAVATETLRGLGGVAWLRLEDSPSDALGDTVAVHCT
jgi:hypothetical protein